MSKRCKRGSERVVERLESETSPRKLPDLLSLLLVWLLASFIVDSIHCKV
jgi:hypothetical protein